MFCLSANIHFKVTPGVQIFEAITVQFTESINMLY